MDQIQLGDAVVQIGLVSMEANMKEYTVRRYSFSELSPEAQTKAIEHTARDNYECLETSQIAESMLVELQERLTGEQGTGDTPPSLKLLDWDVDYQQEPHARIDGELTQETAPALAWCVGVERIDLSWHHYYGQQITCYDSEGEEIDTPEGVKAMVCDLQGWAMKTGRAEMDYYGGEEWARECLQNGEADGDVNFLENGTYAPVRGEVQLTNA